MRRPFPSAHQPMPQQWGPPPSTAFHHHHQPPYPIPHETYRHQHQLGPPWPHQPPQSEFNHPVHTNQQPPSRSGRIHVDDVTQRLKEEQRRKQLEYHQALALQVHERELQKQRERELRRRDEEPSAPLHHEAAPPQRGLFDGLGQNNPSQRGGHFGRGRRDRVDPPPPQQPSYPSQPVPDPPRWPPVDEQQQPTSDWSGHQVDQFHPPSPTRAAHQPAAGRRRTDLHTGGMTSDAQTIQRQQQQLEMQESLRRQIEEKQRAKQEEKRKREEEERREMEKFEQEKKRQHEEQERLKEERRRKALVEEEHYRQQQQQLAAATAAAAQEQRQLKDQRHRPTQSPHKEEPTGGVQQDPFSNSRAHLFRDPTPPPRQVPSTQSQIQPHHHPQIPDQPHPHPQVPHRPQMQYQPQYQPHIDPHVHTQPHEPMQPFNHVHHGQQLALDPHVLMDQYQQVRDELERQRQLVEQLHFQLQQQQQQQHQHASRNESTELPTLTDLERLRQELREELEHRESLHRQELEALRRQQQQQQPSPTVRSPTFRHTKSMEQDPLTLDTMRHQPSAIKGLRRRHDAFVQEALDEEEEDEEQPEDPHESHSSNQRLSPQSIRSSRPTRLRERSQLTSSDLLSNSSTTSLQCDSKLVFLEDPTPSTTKGHAKKQCPQPPELVVHTLDDSVDDLVQSVSESQQTMAMHRSARGVTTSNQEDTTILHKPLPAVDDDEDSLGFFVRTVDRIHPVVDRYGSLQQSKSSLLLSSVDADRVDASTQSLHRRVCALLQHVDDEDEDGHDLDESLDGEKLEAIFQRNVRRHEILSGFEARTQQRPPDPQHWQQLHQQLQKVPVDVAASHNATREESLVASSRWMPSTVGRQ